MKTSPEIIPLARLLLAFIPVGVTLGIIHRWSAGTGTGIYAVVRMMAQLLLIGYVLAFVFGSDSSPIIVVVLSIMLLASSWIALRPVKGKHKNLYLKAFAAISLGGVTTLVLITQFVVNVRTWYEPHFVIPLGGMVFANSMNAVSLAAERFEAEKGRGADWAEARHTAFRAALIPLVNSLFAVGLVSLPGMMTGQILSGVSPLVAARYQIMVMCMIFGSSGISAASYLTLIRPESGG